MSWQSDLNYGLAAFGLKIPDRFSLDTLAPRLVDSPARNTAAIVATSAALFYMAERDHNPKVNDLYDALIYCSTCLSVGYGDIFARTPIGKLIGTALMTYGPALTGAALDGKADSAVATIQSETLALLQKLERQLKTETFSPPPAQ